MKLIMPQIFQVLRCYKCSVFQVHQTKKSNKWQCKLCGEKQSIKRHYSLGTAKDCRLHVKKLNGLRGEIDLAAYTENDDEVEHIEPSTVFTDKPLKKSKWSDYVDDFENNDKKSEEIHFIENTEVFIEVPKKKRKLKNNSFKVPMKDIGNADKILQVPRVSNECAEIIQSSNEKSNALKQECFNIDKDYNSTSLEMPLNMENFKASTEIFSVQNKPKIDTQESQVSTPLITPKVNKSSGWAQYVDSEENINEAVCKPHTTLDLNKIPQSLFTICDDKDLDDVLDI